MLAQSKKSYSPGDIDFDHDFVVRIPFEIALGNTNKWNETCARAIELFGLPGAKYSCRFTSANIEFWFREEKDALMFELCCG